MYRVQGSSSQLYREAVFNSLLVALFLLQVHWVLPIGHYVKLKNNKWPNLQPDTKWILEEMSLTGPHPDSLLILFPGIWTGWFEWTDGKSGRANETTQRHHRLRLLTRIAKLLSSSGNFTAYQLSINSTPVSKNSNQCTGQPSGPFS